MEVRLLSGVPKLRCQMCDSCRLLTAVLEKATSNTKRAIELYDDVVKQRESYKRMLEELMATVKDHMATCHGQKYPNFEQWMN